MDTNAIREAATLQAMIEAGQHHSADVVLAVIGGVFLACACVALLLAVSRPFLPGRD